MFSYFTHCRHFVARATDRMPLLRTKPSYYEIESNNYWFNYRIDPSFDPFSIHAQLPWQSSHHQAPPLALAPATPINRRLPTRTPLCPGLLLVSGAAQTTITYLKDLETHFLNVSNDTFNFSTVSLFHRQPPPTALIMVERASAQESLCW